MGGAGFAIWPGVVGAYPLGRMFYVGADLRLTVILGGETGFAFFALGGLRF